MILLVALIIVLIFSTAIWILGAFSVPNGIVRTGCIIYAILSGLCAICCIAELIKLTL